MVPLILNGTPVRNCACCSAQGRSPAPLQAKLVRAKRSAGSSPRGFSLLELLLVLAIILTISAMAVPNLLAALTAARNAHAAGDINTMETEVAEYQIEIGPLPDNLTQIGRGTYNDPWGQPYQYFNHTDNMGNGLLRLDQFGVPLNQDYDLYSMGANGQSGASITATVSQDDIVRGGDGGYVGLASAY